ncbi:AlwI family type II restriction endonuclease [Psychroserpens mesophilus]|uniref:AlwI family type II restriction endonuclease n=1 Tax=Psychroserpens mesophilus TaxID=325473 RepID=UPI003D65DC50
MAQKNRDKEYWLIPKRANLHQSVVLLKGILDSNYNGKTWNGSKQDRLGSYLGKNGATKNGKNITPQSLRTLLASIPQYFGFTFINTDTTPNSLFVTEAGHTIVKELESFLEDYDYPNLKEAEKDGGTINFSETYLKQFFKLQLTNPVILKDCEGILVFPLIFTLKVLKKTRYLTREEIALFVFRSKSQNDIDFISLEIENFRNLEYKKQLKLVDAFKQTHLGNISLVKASSSSYYEKLCSFTGLIKKSSLVIGNSSDNRKVNTIEIISEKEFIIDQMLNDYNSEPYDFKDNLSLWLQYIGNTEVHNTPKDITISNKTSNEQLVVVSENNLIINGNLINPDDVIQFPAIEKNNYVINIYNKSDGSIAETINYTFSDKDKIEIKNINTDNVNELDVIDIEEEIIEHINSKGFSYDYLKYISIISEIVNKNLQKSKNLRGSRLEYLFYKYFENLENNSIIDEVIWNGKIGQYGIPTPSPGGPTGSPDILLFIDDMIVVVELTTIKGKSQQWSAEGASVPDHIRLVEEKYPDKKIFALYLAPIIHEERVTKGMLSRLEDYESKLHCLEIEKFLNYSSKFSQKNDFIEFLES